MTKKDIILNKYYEDPNFRRVELARKLKVDESYIRKVIRKAKKNTINQEHKPLEDTIDFNRTSKNNATLTLQSTTIHTLDQAIEIAKVDLTQWTVDRWTSGSWQVTLKLHKEIDRYKDKNGKMVYVYEDEPRTVTMYKIQVWFKRLHNIEWVEAVRDLIKDVPKLKVPKKRKFPKTNYMLEVSLHDVHFGMLAWDKETKYDYDIDIAEEVYLYAVEDLLNKAKGYQPSRIVFPFGNDFLHIDDPTNQTPQNRNLLDADSRLIKIYNRAKRAVIKAIDKCREIAPVDVLWVPGNHDPNVSFYMCDVLKEVFSNDKDVSVNVSPKWRKFYSWGDGLLVFTHGIEEPLRDLPGIIATEEPILWGNSKYREIHIGHKHKKMEMRWVGVDTYPGAVVRMIPSIATADAWHYRKGYIQTFHAAEAYLWDYRYGMIGQFTSFVDYDKMQNK